MAIIALNNSSPNRKEEAEATTISPFANLTEKKRKEEVEAETNALNSQRHLKLQSFKSICTNFNVDRGTYT